MASKSFKVAYGEETNARPCVILQHNSANKSSPKTIVAPITHTTSSLPIVIPIVDKLDSNGDVVLDGNVLLGNIVCISKARLGDYVVNLTPDEMKKIDYAISLSLDLNHYYQTMQNTFNDKLQYIEKLKNIRNDLNKEIASYQLILANYQALLDKFDFSDIKALENFLEKHSKNT